MYIQDSLIDKSDRAQAFNYLFASIGSDISKSIPSVEGNSFYKYLKEPIINSFYFHQITKNDIYNALIDIKSKTSRDINGIDMNIIKIVFNLILEPLLYNFNQIIHTSTIPNQMEIAIIIPIYKNGKHEEINNYRPISLLPQFSKIFEKMFIRKMLLFIDRNNILYKNQYGFIAKYSTVHAHIHNYNFLTSGFQKNNKMASIFLDLKKAFDTVNHDILLKKLEYYGFRGKSMTLLKSYLSNRSQITKLGENSSSKLNINIGVPQGSILGPILFILYINDIHKCLDISDDRNFILFAI